MHPHNISSIFSRKYILASASPRRAVLLNQIGLKFTSFNSGVKEKEPSSGNPIQIVKHNSLIKSFKISETCKDEIIIGADTIVVLNGKILNKPKSKIQAVKFLKMLSGKKHFVYTGVSLIDCKSGRTIFFYEKTDVYFKELSKQEIEFYVKNYSPLDKAGAYGIQDDFGCVFIKKIKGDFYNVVGLPLFKLYNTLLKFTESVQKV